MLKTVYQKTFFTVHWQPEEHFSWTGKKPTSPTIPLVECFFFTCSATAFFTPQWMVVHEQVFLGPPWTKSFAKSLFLVVHEQLYGIVQQHAFIPRWWTPPNSPADYLTDGRTDKASYRDAWTHLKNASGTNRQTDWWVHGSSLGCCACSSTLYIQS